MLYKLPMDPIDILIRIAMDITSGLTAEARYQRLLGALKRVIPYDAAAILRLEDREMTLVAAEGLTPDAMGRRFRLEDHPRLDIIRNAGEPIRFASDSDLPDPFDGFLTGLPAAAGRIHACLGCPLFVEDRIVGALTADALTPGAFDGLDMRFVQAAGALAGAEMHTIDLILALEHSADKLGRIARELIDDARRAKGQEIVGAGRETTHLRREIDLVAPSDFSVLVTGETGVGKELVVRAIHAASRRREAPLLYLNCAALPETLAESELFGHARGAFTGAVSDRAGKFELADGGTLFLDEIGELPLAIQPKLLRALQEGEIQRVGQDRVQRVDVRLLAATNRNLAAEVAAGRFRADLYHRLNVYPIEVPPLRERLEDLPMLAGHFCERIQRRLGLGPVRLTAEALGRLTGYHWPGNVRELENVISRAVLKASTEHARGEQVPIEARHLSMETGAGIDAACTQDPAGSRPIPREKTLREAVEAFQRSRILEAVDASGGNWAAAARLLGMHRSNLHKLARRLGILGG
ncbi:MAG: nitric oxide reductase transcriptional regulator NorR [Desulfobacterales bacterium]